jgi:hypothetical protein
MAAEVLVDIVELGDQGLDTFMRAVHPTAAVLTGICTEVPVVLDPVAEVVLGEGYFMLNMLQEHIINVVLGLVVAE